MGGRGEHLQDGQERLLKDVNLNEKAEVASRVYWGGKHYDRSNNLM